MKRLALVSGALVLSALPTAAHAADSETAVVSLPSCSQGTPVSNVRIPDCSYIALVGTDGSTSFGQVSSTSPVTWKGTSTNGKLQFPSTQQSWPGLTLNSVVSASLTPATVNGQVGADGQMTVEVPLNVRISVLGAHCTVSGSVTVSTESTDSVGGGQGQRRDPSTGRFALAGTTTTAPTLTGSSSICQQAKNFIDLNRGIGFYFVGTLVISPTSTGAVVGAQTAAFSSPSKIKRKGRTVLLARSVVTNADQSATVTVRWGRTKAASGTSPRYATVKTTAKGKVTLITTGKAKRLHVRMTVSAPPVDGFSEYLQTRRWVVR